MLAPPLLPAGKPIQTLKLTRCCPETDAGSSMSIGTPPKVSTPTRGLVGREETMSKSCRACCVRSGIVDSESRQLLIWTCKANFSDRSFTERGLRVGRDEPTIPHRGNDKKNFGLTLVSFPFCVCPHLHFIHVDVSTLRDMLREKQLAPLIVTVVVRIALIQVFVAGEPVASDVDFYSHLVGGQG